MFDRKAKAQAPETGRVKEPQPPPAPARPSVLDRLRKKRAEMIAEANWLDKEIEKLDHDITFVERHPMSAHVLEFIAARFNEEGPDQPKHPWSPAIQGG
jgi:hypothetical protein